jgi:hypothetical protein
MGVADVPAPPADAPVDAAPPPPSSATVMLGSGQLMFESITEGAVLPSICGPQGGRHIWTSLRLNGFERTRDGSRYEVNVDLDLKLINVDSGETVGAYPGPWRVPRATAMGPVEIAGIFNFIYPPWDAVIGARLKMTVEVKDAAGHMARAESPTFTSVVDTMTCGTDGVGGTRNGCTMGSALPPGASQACSDCTTTQCTDCSPACGSYQMCTCNCAGDPTCITACGMPSPDCTACTQAFGQCVQSTCAADCVATP